MNFRYVSMIIGVLASWSGGCDKAGVYPLGREKDAVVACAAQTTWVRSLEGATEVLVVGVTDLDDPALEIGDGSVCFTLARVQHDSSTRVLLGALAVRGGGFEVTFGHENAFDYEPDLKVLRRKGAHRIDFEIPTRHDVDLRRDGVGLVVAFDGEARRFTPIGEVIARLDPAAADPEAPGGAKDIFRLFNLPMFTSQARVATFGSGGMTTYVNNATTFNGLVSGEFIVSLESLFSPTAHFDYVDFQDLGGIVIRGLQLTKSDTAGNGMMEGILDVDFFRPDDGETPFLRVAIDYGDLEVRNGVAAGGFYTMTYGDQEHVVGYEIATDEDLTNILPIEEGVP